MARTQASSSCFPSVMGFLESFALPADPAPFICPAREPPSRPPWAPQPSISQEPQAPCHTWAKREMSRAGWRASHGDPAPTPSSTISSLLPLEQSPSMGRTGIQLPPIRCHRTMGRPPPGSPSMALLVRKKSHHQTHLLGTSQLKV